ncbi:MAG: adenosylmethionine decarboxylase [Candidatus Nitrosomaritimum yanchengensis]
MSQIKRFPVENGTTTFGLHLMLDAYDVPKEKLDDMKLAYKFLNELPEKIGMKKLTTPLVADADQSATEFDPGGISGVVLINESHISIHTFADKGFFTMDIYSCSDFSEQQDDLLEHIRDYYPFKDHELQIVTRGKKYPMHHAKK